jgi:D-alanine--poly(phosphoribitol) ligase subunit 2
MKIKDEVIMLLAEVCQDDVVKENPDIDLFENGLLDSFGIIELLVGLEEKFGLMIPITEVEREVWNTPNHIAEQVEQLM